MAMQQEISAHYTRGDLLAAIQRGLKTLGKADSTVTVDDLAPVDEFHIGGRRATEELLGRLDLAPGKHVLDVGCGLAGAARFAASRYGCRVSGIDLTPEFVETAKELCRWVKLDGRISLQQGSALALPFPDRSFDGAYMLHVGMNIADKAKLCAEVGRVLKPGAAFGIFDIMRVGEGELSYPVPWATSAAESAVAEPAQYRRALEAAGFGAIAERNRHDAALAFFEQVRAKAAAGPAPLGLHVVMGRAAPDKMRNMIDNVTKGRLSPVEIIARKT